MLCILCRSHLKRFIKPYKLITIQFFDRCFYFILDFLKLQKFNKLTHQCIFITSVFILDKTF